MTDSVKESPTGVCSLQISVVLSHGMTSSIQLVANLLNSPLHTVNYYATVVIYV